MNVESRVVALLLAAGRSRRMGAFKPFLPFGPRTVIEACLENLREAGLSRIIVVVGHRADEVRARLKDWPVDFVHNPDPSSAMSASIACGVATINAGEADAVMIALADQPAIPPIVMRSLLEARRATGAKLIVPEWQGRRGHPVLIDLALRDDLLRLDETHGLRALLDQKRDLLHRVSVTSPYVVRDVDTWAEYCALHEEIFGKRETA